VSIGSCNFDRWNLQWNLEANQEIDDSAMAGEFADLFRTDFSHSVEHLPDEWARRGWYQRTLEWLWQRVERLSMKIRHRRR
jgi:phosphatidylserine/phosphatidylglycerophosphate/cardiolipin synthase-like enzyme